MVSSVNSLFGYKKVIGGIVENQHLMVPKKNNASFVHVSSSLFFFFCFPFFLFFFSFLFFFFFGKNLKEKNLYKFC